MKDGKVKAGGKTKLTASIRLGKYDELKTLWEAINQKVVLEYKLDNGNDFKLLFKCYLIERGSQFVKTGSMSQQQRFVVEQNIATYRIELSAKTEILPFKMMGYQAFLKALSKETALGIGMLHEVFGELLASKVLDINPYMSLVAIREIKKGFNEYLMAHVFGKFEVGYRKTSNAVHPTKFTSLDGTAKASIDSADVGVYASTDTPPNSYLSNEIFYDSPLELSNINSHIEEVIVYTKIPKSSISIPLVGGYTYSPDFAYVVKMADGNSALNLVVKAKDKTELGLGGDEAQRIKHAEVFFNQLNAGVKVSFKKQLKNGKIVDLINQAISQEQAVK